MPLTAETILYLLQDGDRHDHIVSRGAAKRRLQALRTLPEKLFFICVNFQIPGDPPVSFRSTSFLVLQTLDIMPLASVLRIFILVLPIS